MIKNIVLTVFCLLTVPVLLHAGETVTAISTDRPDQTESTSVVQPGYIQIEAGAVYTESDSYGTGSTPGLLIRTGLSGFCELRLGVDGWSIPEKGSIVFGDSRISTKVRIGDESGFMPETAILAEMSIPTGEEGNSSERCDPMVKFIFKNTLNDMMSVGYNAAIAWQTAEYTPGKKTTLAVMPYSVSLGIGLSKKAGMFAEIYGEAPINARGDATLSIDSGFTYLITDTFQIDCSGGLGLNDSADDWFISGGFGLRLPK